MDANMTRVKIMANIYVSIHAPVMDANDAVGTSNAIEKFQSTRP